MKNYDYSLVEHSIIKTAVTTGEKIPDGIADTWASAMWEEDYTGKGIVIAVLDTGCALNHPDLKDRIIGGRNFTIDYNGDVNNYTDNNFHGTHVAGIIAASKNEQGIVGMAPDAKLFIGKVADSKGNGMAIWLLNAIRYCTNWVGPNGEKIRIINMSLAGNFIPSTVHDAIKDAIAKGITFVCASGNAGDGKGDTDEINYPAYYPEVISVGAYDGWGKVADFSNSNNQLDLVAPGVNIYSTWHIDNGYITLSGTSMASPHVAGAVALIANKLDKAFKRQATDQEIYEELVNKTTVALDVPKTQQGFGTLRFVHAKDAVEYKVKPADVNFDTVLKWLKEKGMFNTPDYWKNNAVAGKTVKGEYMREALIKMYIVLALEAKVDQ